jgi:hypothetical protein
LPVESKRKAGLNDGDISYCYAGGTIKGIYGFRLLGGFAAENRGSISNCFWDIDTIRTSFGVASVTGPIVNLLSKTTAQMYIQSTFADYGWDFVGEIGNGTEDIWHMPYQATGYPMLYWQRDIAGDLTGSYGVNFADFAVLANAWLSTPADDNWNLVCDLKPDNVIDILDLQILVENWLTE